MAYTLAGLTIDTAVPFPELSVGSGSERRCAFGVFEFESSAIDVAPFLEHALPTGASITYGTCAEGYVVRLGSVCTFVISRDGDVVRCYRQGADSDGIVKRLFLDHIVPLVLHLRGREVLHASAVSLSSGACAFLANSGGGKSTLVASFAASGDVPVADDCLVLVYEDGRVYGHTSYPGIRLWPDSVSAVIGDVESLKSDAAPNAKRRVTATSLPDAPLVALDCLYLLESPANPDELSVRIEPLSPRDATLALIRSAFRLDITDNAMLVAQFRFLAGVAARVPVRRLTYPRVFALLPRVRDAVVADLRAIRSGR